MRKSAEREAMAEQRLLNKSYSKPISSENSNYNTNGFNDKGGEGGGGGDGDDLDIGYRESKKNRKSSHHKKSRKSTTAASDEKSEDSGKSKNHRKSRKKRSRNRSDNNNKTGSENFNDGIDSGIIQDTDVGRKKKGGSNKNTNHYSSSPLSPTV